MAITFSSAGTPVYGFNTTVTPTAPIDTAGVGLILVTGELAGSDTISTPSGWTALDLVSGSPQVAQVRAFGLTAAGSDTMPSISWGNQWAFAVVLAFNGLDPSFTAAFSPAGRQSNQTVNIVGPSVGRTPSQPGSLVLFYGQRDKTSTTDGTTYSAPTNFTMAPVNGGQHAGTSVSFGISYWIQSAATTVSANLAMAGTLTESAVQTTQAVYMGILAAAASAVPHPPFSQGGMNVQVCM